MEKKRQRAERSDIGSKRENYNLSDEGRQKHREVAKRDAAERKLLNAETRARVIRGQKPKYTNGFLMALRLAVYMQTQKAAEKPLTISGLYIALGLSDMTMYAYKYGDNDNIIDEIIAGAREDFQGDLLEELFATYEDDGDVRALYEWMVSDSVEVDGKRFVYFSDVLEKANRLLSIEREERLYEKGRVADIFALKAQDGWQENDSPQTLNQTLVINGNGADEALKLLGYSKIESKR